MNIRQKRFIESYIQTGNASEAARRAGYSARSAYSIGEENLKKPEICAAIAARLQELEDEQTANTQEVLKHLTRVLRGLEKETTITQSGKEFITPVKEFDRLKAADMLLRVHGAYKDKTEINVKGLDYYVAELKASFALDT